MSDISADMLKNNLTNPARSYLWDVIIPAPIGGGDSTALQVRCQSTKIPGRSVGIISIPYKQTAGIQYHGKLTYSHTWDCTFVEGEDKKIFAAMYAWAQRVINDRTTVGSGDENIKADIYLSLITTKNSEWARFKMKGCFPSDLPQVDLTYTADGYIIYPITFQYDSWENVK